MVTPRFLSSRTTLLVSSYRRSHQRWVTASSLTIERKTDASDFKQRPQKEHLVFGTTLSDHMLMIEWDKKNLWGPPRIVPYQDLKISPAASCLHYGTWEDGRNEQNRFGNKTKF